MHYLPILNRANFETTVSQLETNQLALAQLDLDSFKEVNDTLGHEAGDTVLRSLERTLSGSLPNDAIVGRLGGDEYAVALPDTTAESALILLEEIRQHFSGRNASPEVPRKIQLSVGIAAKPPHAKSVTELMRCADEALYRAKREGRSRVSIYVEDKMTLKSNFYPKAQLERLSKLSSATGRTEASLLREALESLLNTYRDEL
ncbi:MAG: GGDEF domain-containing protein [Pleurocapsa sp. SU_196_0]|nr:GGDEF domain-containing protein [Pleurocapsa sp. SU_196_0]